MGDLLATIRNARRRFERFKGTTFAGDTMLINPFTGMTNPRAEQMTRVTAIRLDLF
jgi:hypothetical protein